MPVQCKSHKLSKIDTLRLARNYIVALSCVVQGTSDPLVFAQNLTQGIGQSTCNIIANSLNASLRNLHLNDTSSLKSTENVTTISGQMWQSKPENQVAYHFEDNPLDSFVYDWS